MTMPVCKAVCFAQNVYILCWHYAQCFCHPIMHAQNYAGITGSSIASNILSTL